MNSVGQQARKYDVSNDKRSNPGHPAHAVRWSSRSPHSTHCRGLSDRIGARFGGGGLQPSIRTVRTDYSAGSETQTSFPAALRP